MLISFSDRNNQRAHDVQIVRQVRRLLKDANEDNDTLKNDIRQQIKRLASMESQSEILGLLFHTDYLDFKTIRMFIEETSADLEKTAHYHNPQESVHLQDFCQNSINLLNIYTAIEQIRAEHAPSISENNSLFTKEVTSRSSFDIISLRSFQEFQNELHLTDDETSLYYQFFEEVFAHRSQTTKRKVRFNSNDNLSSKNFTFGQFQSMLVPSRQQTNQLEIKSTINSDDFSQLGLYLFSSWFWLDQQENVDENFRSYLQSIHFKTDDLVLLSLHSLLSIPLTLPQSLQIWKTLFSMIYSMNENKTLILTIIEKTTNGLTALLLTLIFRSCDQEINLHLLIRRLSALVAVRNLCSSMKTDEEQDQIINELTVESIFIKHRHDYLLELIARKIIEGNIPPSWLTSIESQDNPFQSIITDDSREKKNLFFILVHLTICRQILPHSFEKTILLIYSSWTCMSMWHKQIMSATNPSSMLTHRTVNDLIRSSFEYYNHIQIGIVKQNLGTLLWSTFLRSRISTLTQLIEKIGKIPKDRLCYKELRLNEKDLIDFLEQISQNFFESYIQSIYNQLNEIPIFNIDDTWQMNTQPISITLLEPVSPFINLYPTNSTSEQSDQPNSLLESVMEQKSANGHLVLHHDKLIHILYYLMLYHMKSIRPFSLFDSKGIHAFFTDLHSHPLVTDDVDANISTKRQLFFARLLNTIFEQRDSTKVFDEKIFENILRLSTDMLVDHEYIRRHYISLLYAYNNDRLAIHEENRIHDRQALAFQLLIIAGLRLNHMIEGNIDLTMTKISTKALEIRAKMSSTLKTWLASLSTLVDYKVQPCSLESIESMLTRTACYLPQTNLSQSNLAQEMIELVHLLKR